MRVLFIQEEFCIRALKQAAALTAHGIEVYGLSLKEPGTFYRLKEAKDWFKQYATGPLNHESIKQVCKKWNIDVIHSHNWPDSYTLQALKAKCCAVVHDTHDMQSLIMEDMKQKFNPQHAEEEKLANTSSTARIYVTEHMAQIANKRYGVNDKMLIIPCLSSVAFKPPIFLSKLNLTNGKINIVYEGGLVDNRVKNHSYYMYDVIKRLALEPNFEIHIYMSNDDQKVIQYYRSIGQNVHVKGKISPSQLAIELTQYDYGLALFNTNIQNSDCLATGFANKFGDYLLSGVPPIADMRTPAMYQFLKDNQCGIAGSTLEECINLIKQGTYASPITEDVISLLTYESCFDEIKKLYEDAIASFRK